MRVNGIVAEYNPFHNGHKYQLNTCKELTGADYTIVAMSGNFVQRGAPALVDKFTRAKMALLGGADLVLEIPSFYACASAEYYAAGSVALLDKLGVVDCLCFGSECGDIDRLQKTAALLAEEPDTYQNALRQHLSAGRSFPAARQAALHELTGECNALTFPNDILGAEYCKALLRRKSTIRPVTVTRIGSAYHASAMDESELVFPSATAIRQRILVDSGPSESVLSAYRTHLPDAACDVFWQALRETGPLSENDLSAMLLYALLQNQAAGYTAYLDISEDLSAKIQKHLYQYRNFNSFCELLKSKNLTYTRISRCLLHILLSIKKESLVSYQAMDYVPYARILGFKKDAAPLLSAIKRHASASLISKLADAYTVLSEEALGMLQEDVHISNLYCAVRAQKNQTAIRNEYSTPIVVI